MSFSRDAAVAHAAAHWFSNCADGLIATNAGMLNVNATKAKLKLPDPSSWRVAFLPNPGDRSGKETAFFVRRATPGSTAALSPIPELATELGGGMFEKVKFHEDAGLLDCAHYISECLRAGGHSINTNSVPVMIDLLARSAGTKVLGVKLQKSRVQPIIDAGLFRPGDMIGYFFAGDAKDHSGGYTHSAMFMGNNQITCHSHSRFKQKFFNDDWTLVDASDNRFRYTLIHFPSDDPPSTHQAQLTGWWEVKSAAGTRSCFLRPNGASMQFTRKPFSFKQAPAGAPHGHWFDQGTSVLICWESDGALERWGFGPAFPAQAFGFIDRVRAVTAIKQ